MHLSAALTVLPAVALTLSAVSDPPYLSLDPASDWEPVFIYERDVCPSKSTTNVTHGDAPDSMPLAWFKRGADPQVSLIFATSAGIHASVGPDLNSLKRNCDRVVFNSTFAMTPDTYANHQWLQNVRLLANGSAYGLVHNEFKGELPPHRIGQYCSCSDVGNTSCRNHCELWSTGLAVSHDGGDHFELVAKPPHHLVAALPARFTFDQRLAGYGAISPMLPGTDGYYYGLINVAGNSNASGVPPGNCLLRTPDLTDPAAFRGMDKDGGYTVQWHSPYEDTAAGWGLCHTVPTSDATPLAPHACFRQVHSPSGSTEWPTFLASGDVGTVEGAVRYAWSYETAWERAITNWTAPRVLPLVNATRWMSLDTDVLYPVLFDVTSPALGEATGTIASQEQGDNFALVSPQSTELYLYIVTTAHAVLRHKLVVSHTAPPPPPPPPPPPLTKVYPEAQPCASEPLKSAPICDPTADLETRVADIVSRVASNVSAPLFSDQSQGVEALNIPFYNWWSEALHGVSRCPYEGNLPPNKKASGKCCVLYQGQSKCPTSFPAGITTSCSFNKTLFNDIGTAIGTEARVMSNAGIASLTFWTPNVNIFRDPRWGRGQECPGEDPTLNGDYAEGFVSGFQTGEDPNFLKASSCCKHYAAYNLEKWSPNGPSDPDPMDRHHFNAIVSEQDLTDTYFPAFTSCANRGNASGVMCSYNAVNGVPSCASKTLLDDTLRGKWGFNGYVTSDCGAVGNVYTAHNYTHTTDETAAVTLGAGMDNDCGGFFGSKGGPLNSAINDGAVTNAVREKAMGNLFRVQIRLGMFDPDESNPYRSYGPERVDTLPHRTLALLAARQGMTLVKNVGNALPLKRTQIKTVAVVGPHGNATEALQSNYHGTAPYIVSPAEGIAKYAAVNFVEGTGIDGPVRKTNISAAVTAATQADATIILIGLDNTQEGEGHDRYSITLPGNQSQLVEAVAAAAKGPVVVVFVGGGACDFSDIKASSKVDAVIIAGYPGQEGGNAIAQTIFGDNNPAGRLTQTWYTSEYITQCSFFDMNMRPNSSTGCPGRTHRFYTGTPVFAFGEGMSYTTFAYETEVSAVRSELKVADINAKVEAARYRPHLSEEVVRVSATVTNNGDMDGDEVILVMLKPPSTAAAAAAGAPRQQLGDYDRIHLKVGQTKTVEFRVTAHDLAFAHPDGAVATIDGPWTIQVGSADEMALSIAP